MHLEVIGSFQDIALFFYHVCVKDGVQAVSLGGKCFYLFNSYYLMYGFRTLCFCIKTLNFCGKF